MKAGTRFVFRWASRLRLPHMIIFDDDGSPYLLRIYLTPRGDWWRDRMPGVFLHYFFRGDGDRELHNHPWNNAVSFVLTNGYLEERLDLKEPCLPIDWKQKYEVRPVLPLTFNRIGKYTFHRVQLFNEDSGCWTLFIAGSGEKTEHEGETKSLWGFLDVTTGSFERWFDRAARKSQSRSANDSDPGRNAAE